MQCNNSPITVILFVQSILGFAVLWLDLLYNSRDFVLPRGPNIISLRAKCDQWAKA